MSYPLRSRPAPRGSHGSTSALLRDVLQGLSQPSKRLPCKYFYDTIGGQLFERICDLDEYYPTRCELDILERHAAEMARCIGPDVAFIEYGSGSSRKTCLLLDQLREPATYCPVDINGEQLRRTARSLSRRYPHLDVQPVEADFTRSFTLPALHRPAARRVVYFSGSTIGNFEHPAAREILERIAALCGQGGGLLVAVDLKKDPHFLHAAYNDASGITAAFNRNLLARLNRELGADFAPEFYHHYAFYNPSEGRIEMHLVSRSAQRVHIGDAVFTLEEGESICTEYSYKYSLAEFARSADEAGLRVRQVWLDEHALFSVQYLEVQAR